MDRLKLEALSYIQSLANPEMQDKAAIQNVLLSRKVENLRLRFADYRKIERQAIALMGKVDYTDIAPSIAWVAPKDLKLWRFYRDVLSSAPFDGRPGRVIYGFVVDRNTGGVMGIFEVGSDMAILGPRDVHIGWKHEDRFGGGMLRHVYNLGTCVPVQPFGWLTGGKFIASATASKDVFDIWLRRYGDKLAAGVTTSLYGKSSQYERLKEWQYLGETNGTIGIAHISKDGRKLLSRFVKEYAEVKQYGASGSGVAGLSGNTLNVFINACKTLGLEPSNYSAKQPRGVYFAEMGQNALRFLRREIDDFLPDTETMKDKAAFWLKRWYQMRLPKKLAEIQQFDFNTYTIQSQIEYINARLNHADVGEIESRVSTTD
jgi:hypothetical protein